MPYGTTPDAPSPLCTSPQVAHRALEEAAAASGGESEREASARYRGVSLARNVLANAADELAHQGWAVAIALNERLEQRVVPEVVRAVRAVRGAAMDAAGAVDAQLDDAELRARSSEVERRKLKAKRAQATALLERATDLIRVLESEAAEQASSAEAAERAVDEAEVARAQLQARDELHAMRLLVCPCSPSLPPIPFPAPSFCVPLSDALKPCPSARRSRPCRARLVARGDRRRRRRATRTSSSRGSSCNCRPSSTRR